MASGYVTQFIRIVCLVIFCMVWGSHPLLSREAEEYKVKAAFLYNFIKFVQWPKSAFSDGDTPYRICVMGDPDIFSQFEVIEGKESRHRSIQLLWQSGGKPPPDCHVLFISRRIPRQMARQAIRATAGKPVLIIGEIRGFIPQGGSINFFFKDDRLQFEINPEAAAARGLEISSRLLKLAVIVEASE